jgi:uncharacterized protein YndB with AHSA1/START domain
VSEPVRTIESCVMIHAPREEVFRFLLDPAALSRWMYATVLWKPTKGASYRIEWQDTSLPAVAQGEILEIEENRRLVLSWFMERDGCETVASFELHDDEPGRTHLKFRHTGFPGDPSWQVRCDLIALEWEKVLENLRFHVEERREGVQPFYLRHQVKLPASRERAHLYWVGPAAIRTWLADQAYVDPAPRGEIDLTLREGKRVRGEIRTFLPGRHMRMFWDEEGTRSLLGISFWPDGDGSVMTLTQRSYGIGDAERDAVRALWEARFARLSEVLGREPGSWSSEGTRSIDLERTIEVPRERAWKAWTDPVSLVAWFCDRAEFTLRPAHAYHLLWTSYGEQPGRVLEVASGEKLRLAWDLPLLKATTEVSLAFHPFASDRGRCRLALTHSGWGSGKEWDAEFDAHQSGWRSVLAMLEFYLTDGGKGPRRSFILRRRLPISTGDLWNRFTTKDGIASWLGDDGSVDPKEDGTFRARTKGGVLLEGRITMAHPDGGIAIQMQSPEVAYLEFDWAGDGKGSRILVSGLTYGAPDSWPLRQRILWSERLAKIAGTEQPA